MVGTSLVSTTTTTTTTADTPRGHRNQCVDRVPVCARVHRVQVCRCAGVHVRGKGSVVGCWRLAVRMEMEVVFGRLTEGEEDEGLELNGEGLDVGVGRLGSVGE